MTRVRAAAVVAGMVVLTSAGAGEVVLVREGAGGAVVLVTTASTVMRAGEERVAVMKGGG